jgi:hypothetical protein
MEVSAVRHSLEKKISRRVYWRIASIGRSSARKAGVGTTTISTIDRPLFRLLAPEVFRLDPSIRWFAMEEAGQEPCWAGRDTGAACHAELVDPLLLMVAEGGDRIGRAEVENPHRLLYVVLAYADLVQIVVRFGRSGHIGVAVDRDADACGLGMQLAELLGRYVD